MSERSAVILPNAVPVIQAPMAGGPSTPALTAAVCDGGGYGFVAAGYQSADALQQAIVETRTLTGEPFGVNVFVPSVPGDRSVVSAYASTLQEEAEVLGVALGDGHWDDDHYDAKLDVIASNSVHLASFTFGCPTPEVVDRLHRADVLVAVTVTSVPESLMATGTGADLLIAQGAEAGGHQGSFDDLAANQIPLLSLLAEILETTDLPVVGSGGIMTGSDTAAVLTAGAVAVQFGTVFLCTPEAGTSSPYRRALLDRIYSETIVTRAYSGRFARGLANRFAVEHDRQAPRAYPEVHHLTRPLRAAATRAGDTGVPNLWAGTGWPLVTTEQAATIVRRIATEARAREFDLCRLLHRPGTMAEVVAGTLEPVERVASLLDLSTEDLTFHGPYRAKIRIDPKPAPQARKGRYVLITAITPTRHNAGKSVTTIGLAMGLERIGYRATATIRQSSFGPTFGAKGGGAGGGRSRVEPLEECLLGLGSDVFAVEMANNLLAAIVDDAVHRGADVDPASVTWRRALDVDDRALRQVGVGQGGTLNGPEHQTGFDITAASEVMAILTLSRDFGDLRSRLASIVAAWDRDGKPVTAGSVEAAGSMAVLLRDALRPNLMQTTEGTPVMIHTGPFGNIAPGNSSVIADVIALARSDFVVTEAGFGSDLGAEKFFHLKCPVSGLTADAAVLVATVPCLHDHGGATGDGPDVAAVAAGCANLRCHVENLAAFGVPTVVAINRFPGDTDDEVATVIAAARGAGADAVTQHHAFAQGGTGCIELAEAVAATVEKGLATRSTHQLFDRDAPVEEKVEVIARRLYGASGVEWKPEASARMEQFREAGFGRLPVCMAKTHLSLSHDPSALGAPSGFVLPVAEVRLAAGAGYVTVLTGAISTMPGLPSKAKFREIDLLDDGTVVGLI